MGNLFTYMFHDGFFEYKFDICNELGLDSVDLLLRKRSRMHQGRLAHSIADATFKLSVQKVVNFEGILVVWSLQNSQVFR